MTGPFIVFDEAADVDTTAVWCVSWGDRTVLSFYPNQQKENTMSMNNDFYLDMLKLSRSGALCMPAIPLDDLRPAPEPEPEPTPEPVSDSVKALGVVLQQRKNELVRAEGTRGEIARRIEQLERDLDVARKGATRNAGHVAALEEAVSAIEQDIEKLGG